MMVRGPTLSSLMSAYLDRTDILSDSECDISRDCEDDFYFKDDFTRKMTFLRVFETLVIYNSSFLSGVTIL